MLKCDSVVKSQENNRYDILIIEDTEFINNAIKRTLGKFNYKCEQSLTLKDAKNKIKLKRYDYILLDLNLADGSGVELVKTIKNLSEAKIIILTAETDVHQREVLFKDGILDYIVKDKYFNDAVSEIDGTIKNLEFNKNSTILVIDDSVFLQKHIASILKIRNYNIVSAFNAKDGFEKLSKYDINIIILDMELPDMHGLALLRKIKKSKQFSQIPIMILSGTGTSIIIRDSYKAGAYDFVQKPFNIEELVLKIEISIEADRKSREILCKQQILNDYKDAVDRSSIVSKTNANGVITYVNDKFCEVSGYTKEELVGKHHTMIRHQDMPKSTFEDMWKTIKDKKPWFGKVKNQTKDGGYYWVNTVINPIVDYNGNIIEYIGIRTDITEIENAKMEIQELHKHTKESIEYASHIQQAIIPSNKQFQSYFSDFFTIWKPKDIVGGDIYLFEDLRHEDECLLMLIDCTGHGVPGAFVTMLLKAMERQIVSKIISDKTLEVSPAGILNYFNKTMKKLLKQDSKESVSNVGFDGQIVYYNKKDKIIKIASARNEIFYYQDDKLKIIKGDRHSIGYKDSDIDYKFTEHILDVSTNTTLYLSTDGFWDQNGGKKILPYGKKRLKKLLDEIHNESMQNQREKFLSTLADYQCNFETNDDITMIGLKI